MRRREDCWQQWINVTYHPSVGPSGLAWGPWDRPSLDHLGHGRHVGHGLNEPIEACSISHSSLHYLRNRRCSRKHLALGVVHGLDTIRESARTSPSHRSYLASSGHRSLVVVVRRGVVPSLLVDRSCRRAACTLAHSHLELEQIRSYDNFSPSDDDRTYRHGKVLLVRASGAGRCLGLLGKYLACYIVVGRQRISSLARCHHWDQ